MCNTKIMMFAGSEVLAIEDSYIQCVDVYNTKYNEVLIMLWFLRIKSRAADGQPHKGQRQVNKNWNFSCMNETAWYPFV